MQHLDPAMVPYNNAGDTDPLLEFNVFRKLLAKEAREQELWGALSWKFTKKTGMSGEDLKNYVKANPGHDVYYCNPFPEFESLYQNLWAQGETAHPDFVNLCNLVFESAGLDPALIVEEIQPSKAYSATNSFVGSRRFWAAYIPYIEHVVDEIFRRATPKQKKQLLSGDADMKGRHAGATYLPFIVERLFPAFMASEQGQGLKGIQYPLPEQARNAHLRHLREMKDVACETNSTWLASCWLNYRNLYLMQFHGRDWAQKFLVTITPMKVNFSTFTTHTEPECEPE